jgi:hypothetical protein
MTNYLRGNARLPIGDCELLKHSFGRAHDVRIEKLGRYIEHHRTARHAVKERLQSLAYEPNSMLRIERRMKELERGR